MNSRANRRTLALAALVLALVAFGSQFSRSKELHHNGRPLSAWLADLMAGRDGAQVELAREAILALGTNPLPALLERISAQEPRWPIVHFIGSLVHPFSVAERREQAERAFAVLGPVARPAIPRLREIGRQQPDNASVRVALAELGASGSVNLPDLQLPPAVASTNAPKLAPLLGDGAAAIATRAQWAGHRTELQRAWTLFLGEFPTGKVPLAPEFLKKEELPKFTRQLVTYQIEDGVRTDAMLLAPRGASGRLPAIVLFHPTYSNHFARAVGLEGDDPERHQAVQLVERGYVVLAPRCFIWAELPPDYRRKGESLYVANVRRMQERHPTWKGMTRMTWDGIRALDFLVTLPNVDTNRIGLFGHSLGAKEVVYVAAFDSRPRCVVSSEGGIGTRLSNWQDVWYLGPDIRAPGFAREHHELLALIAPRPFLLLAGGRANGGADGDESWPFLEAALPVYRLLGEPQNLGWFDHGLGHRYGLQARDVAEAFLDRFLLP